MRSHSDKRSTFFLVQLDSTQGLKCAKCRRPASLMVRLLNYHTSVLKPVAYCTRPNWAQADEDRNTLVPPRDEVPLKDHHMGLQIFHDLFTNVS